MSSPFWSASIASGSCSQVYFVAPGALIRLERGGHIGAVRRTGGNGGQIAEHHSVEVLRVERLTLDIGGLRRRVQLVERLGGGTLVGGARRRAAHAR